MATSYKQVIYCTVTLQLGAPEEDAYSKEKQIMLGNRVVATSHHHVVKLFSWEHLKKRHFQEKQIM